MDKLNYCWNWINAKDKEGYGQLTLLGKSIKAHRLSYEVFIGKIPKGLVIDHLCHNTSCINPIHLEAVTQKENIRRGNTGKINNHQTKKRFCPNGHEYNKENTYNYKGNHRLCRKCRNKRVLMLYHKNKHRLISN